MNCFIILVNCYLILINRFLILVNGSLVCNKSREQTPMCPWLTKTRKQMIVLILVQCFLVSDWRRTLLWFWARLSCICLCFRLWGSGSLWRATPAMWRSAQTYTQWWRWRQRSSDSSEEAWRCWTSGRRRSDNQLLWLEQLCYTDLDGG